MIQTELLYAAGIGNARGKALKCQYQSKTAAHVTQKVRSDHDAAKRDERRDHSRRPKDHTATRRLFLKGCRGKPGEHKANRRMRGVPARERLEPVLDHAGSDIGPLVGIADYPPRLKNEPRRDSITRMRGRDHSGLTITLRIMA